MVSTITYLVITIVVGLFVSFLLITLRSTKKRGDSSPYGAIFICVILAVVLPFIYTEALTKIYGKEMEPAINDAYEKGPINGKMQYYRITGKSGNKADALVIGEERQNWGGTDRPIMKVELEKQGSKWKAVSYKLLYSDRENKDNLILPPYH